jgi:hypothetical protein
MATPAKEGEQTEIGPSQEEIPQEEIKEKPPLLPPPPYVVFVFEDGVRGTVRENATVDDWRNSNLVNKIEGEIDGLRGRKGRITEQLLQPLPKTKHGKIIPRPRRREIRRGLKQEREANASRITHKESLIDELGNLLAEKAPQSNPLNPLRFRVTNVIRIEGEPLSPEDQEWWQFVRQQAPEVWGLLQKDDLEDDEEETTPYKRLRGYFQRRLALRDAQGGFSGNPQIAAKNFDGFSNMLSKLPDGEYLMIGPIIGRIRNYFTGEV